MCDYNECTCHILYSIWKCKQNCSCVFDMGCYVGICLKFMTTNKCLHWYIYMVYHQWSLLVVGRSTQGTVCMSSTIYTFNCCLFMNYFQIISNGFLFLYISCLYFVQHVHQYNLFGCCPSQNHLLLARIIIICKIILIWLT